MTVLLILYVISVIVCVFVLFSEYIDGRSAGYKFTRKEMVNAIVVSLVPFLNIYMVVYSYLGK